MPAAVAPRRAALSTTSPRPDPTSSTRAALSRRTRAIVPVHLYGRCADMDALCSLAREHDLVVVVTAGTQQFDAPVRFLYQDLLPAVASASPHP